MNRTSTQILSIIAVCGLTFFWNLGAAKLWDRDEPRNAGCAAEMLDANNWVVPIFNDELRPQKPVLLYWLIMSAYLVFGENEFAARFWSAVLGAGSCLLTCAIGQRLFDSTVGWLAALILATNLMFCVAARAATPDSVLIFCCMLAYWFYIQGTFHDNEIVDGAFPSKIRHWLPFYLALGFAALAKGPIGYLIPMAVVGMFMLIERKPATSLTSITDRLMRFVNYFAPLHFLKTLWAMKFLVGTLLTLFVAFPWYNEVDTQTQGLFTRLFFLKENFARATTTMENHGGGLWFYPLAILVGFFPWAVFVGPTIAFLSNGPPISANQRSAITFLIGWIAIQVITFSLFSTKLPSYVTPCYPALAILTSLGLVQFARCSSTRVNLQLWHVAAMVGLLISGLGITIGFWLGMQKYLPDLRWLSCVGVVPIVGSICGWLLLGRSSKMGFTTTAVVTATVFCWLFFGVGTKVISDQRKENSILQRIALHPCSAVGAWKCMEPSWVVYGQKSIYELQEIVDFEYRGHEDTCRRLGLIGNHRRNGLKNRPLVDEFVVKFPNALIITTDEHLQTLLAKLPDGYETLETSDFFLKPELRLVLLGKRATN